MKFLTALMDGEALYESDTVSIRHRVDQDKLNDPEYEPLLVREERVTARDIVVHNGHVYLEHNFGYTPIDLVSRSSASDHGDDFIYYAYGEQPYARFFLMLHRLPAALKLDFKEFIDEYKLFAKYEDVWYRVTGASRLGDIWLQSNFALAHGYDKRVCFKAITEWARGEIA